MSALWRQPLPQKGLGKGALYWQSLSEESHKRNLTIMTVQEAIAAAERLLPGRAAPEDEEDARWQAVIVISKFIEYAPEAIWPFVLHWGSHEDEDVRAAIATCLLEHLLERHFDLLFPRIETAARSNVWFAKTTALCWKFGQSKDPARAERFDRLCAEIRRRRG
jgi:hypothetical protein